MKKYEKLKEEYPEYISLDQLYQICGIAKRSARYLVEHEIIPAIDTGRKTWRYKITIDDVITYLHRREQNGSMIPPGHVSSRADRLKNPYRKCYNQLVKPGMESKIIEYFTYIYSEYPDVLALDDAAEMTGLDKSTIAKLIRDGYIEAFNVSLKYMIPKACLLNFVVTPRFIDCKSRSEGFKRIVGGFELWQNANK